MQKTISEDYDSNIFSTTMTKTRMKTLQLYPSTHNKMWKYPKNMRITTPPALQYNKKNSTWTPPEGHNKELDLYIECFHHWARTEIINKEPHLTYNLTNTEWDAMHSLRSNPNIVIKEADKGGVVVIMDKSSYTQEAQRQLSNTKFYQPLTTDPTTKYQKELQNLIKDLCGNVREQILKNTPQELQPAPFYLLPKYINKVTLVNLLYQASAPSQLEYLDTWTMFSNPMLPMHPVM
ncbi:hypothetical protein JRQ81_017822 [Phrynocephalus forsythii]|uniref:Uncharacterized protein n=1 Tax=Phrynocephalus forsythii TaxID=171643 RepID=A0A9Q0XT23_9SAUR|nr:hypothetical protein JRQ81_017822 [Phrynocephalus forsythii]